MQKIVSFKDVATVSIKGNDYRIHLYYMSKDEATNLLEKSDLTKKVGHYKIWLFFTEIITFGNIEIEKNVYINVNFIIMKILFRRCRLWKHAGI